MTGRASAAILALVALVGCGPSAPSAPAPDVKGAPLNGPAPAAPAPAAAPAASPDGPAVSAAAPQTPPPPAVDAAPPVAAPPAAGDFQPVSFDELSGFDYALYAEDAKTPHTIPAKILALSGKRVVVDGYMMPLQYESGGAKKFLLLKFQFACCYGGTPKLNEWIEVTMEGGAVAEYIHQQLISVYGTLEVKPQQRGGLATSLYTMKATRSEFTDAK